MTDVAGISDFALAGFFRDTTTRLNGKSNEHDGLLLFDGGTDSTSGALRTTDIAWPPSPEVVRLVTDFFRDTASQGHAVVVRTGIDDDLASALDDAGYARGSVLAGMVLDRWPDGSTTTDAEIRIVRDEVGAIAFRSVVGEAFVADRDNIERMFAETGSILAPDVVAAVAWVAGQPVSAAMVARHDGVAAVDWVSTIPAFRGHGLALAVTRAVTRAAFDAGDAHAALQAGPAAARIYSRLGFREVRNYQWHRSPRP